MDNVELINWVDSLKTQIGQKYPELWHYAEILDEVIDKLGEEIE